MRIMSTTGWLLLDLLFILTLIGCPEAVQTPAPANVPVQPAPGSRPVLASVDQVVYAAATQTLTNKTIDCSSNTCTNLPAGGFVVAMDCDLTAETTQLMGIDGTYTFCGQTWTKKNSANEHTAMTVVNGTGLELFPGHTGGLPGEYTATSCLGSGTADASAPSLRIPLSALGIAGLDWSTQFRISLDVASQTLSAGGDGLVWGVDNNPAGGFSGLTTWYTILGARCSSGSTSPLLVSYAQTGSGASGTTVAVTGYTSWTTGNQTSVLWTGPLAPAGGQYQPLLAYGTAYSSGWTTSLVPWATSSQGAGSGNGSTPSVGFANETPSAIGSALFLFIAATGNVALSSAAITVDRIRIEYRL